MFELSTSSYLLIAVGLCVTISPQLRKIVRAVRSSPQKRQIWLKDARANLSQELQNAGSTAHMLILDVKTRWSLTFQMLSTWFQVHLFLSDELLPI